MHLIHSAPRTFASLLVGALAVTTAIGAQELSYDMSTTATGPARTGDVDTRNMMAAY